MGIFIYLQKRSLICGALLGLGMIVTVVASAAGRDSPGMQAVGGPHFVQEFSKCQKKKAKAQNYKKNDGEIEEIPMHSTIGRDGKVTYKQGDKKEAVPFCRFDDVVCDVTNVVVNPVTDANGKPVKGNKDQVVKGAHISGINCPAEVCKQGVEACANYEHDLPEGVHQHAGDKPGDKNHNGWIEKDKPPKDNGGVTN